MKEPTISIDNLLLATSMTNTATQTANLDTVNGARGKANAAQITIAFAVELNTNGVGPTISLLESDDTVVTNFATVVANRTAEDLSARKIVRYDLTSLNGRKRYLRLSVTTATATNDNITFAAIGTLHHLGQQPASTTDMVATTNDVVVTVT